MSFLNPLLLLGLLAAAIPLIIHLINLRRPKTIRFSTIAFLQELQKTTIKRLNLKRLILLAVRIAAITLLVLALARPLLLSGPGFLQGYDERVDYVLMLDNAPSMSQVDEDGPYMEQAREAAHRLVDQAGEQTRFIVAPSHGEAGPLRAVDASRARERIDRIEVRNEGMHAGARFSAVGEYLAESEAETGGVYWFSDVQANRMEQIRDYMQEQVDMETLQAPLTLVLIGEEPAGNTAVTDVRIDNRMIGQGMPLSIEAEVTHFGSEPVQNYYVTLEIEDQVEGAYEVDLEPGQTRSFRFEVTPDQYGQIRGMVRLEGDPHAFDNTRYFSIHIPESKQVLLIQPQDHDSYLQRILMAARETSGQIAFQQTTPDGLAGRNLDDYHAVVLDETGRLPERMHAALRDYVQRGNGLMLFPAHERNPQDYNRLLGTLGVGEFYGSRGEYEEFEEIASLQQLVEGHPVLDEVFDRQEGEPIRADRPALFHYWLYTPGEGVAGNPVLQTNLGDPLLTEHRVGDGMVMISSIGPGPGWSEFPANPLFAPVYYRSLLYSVSMDPGGLKEHTLGSRFEYTMDEAGRPVELHLDDVSIRPETRTTPDGVAVSYEASDWQPGWVRLQAGEQERHLAINQHILESDFATLDRQNLDELLDESFNLASIIESRDIGSEQQWVDVRGAGTDGIEIWNWFIGLALVFLAAECIISRRFKAESLG